MNRNRIWTRQSSVIGEVDIQLGMFGNQSHFFWLPSGKSFLFFINMGSSDFIISLHGLPSTRTYPIPSGRSGIVTLELPEPREVMMLILCASAQCQGLAMMASCAG